MTLFDQWDIFKYDASRDLESTCIVGLLSLEHWLLGCSFSKPTCQFWETQHSHKERPHGEKVRPHPEPLLILYINLPACKWSHPGPTVWGMELTLPHPVQTTESGPNKYCCLKPLAFGIVCYAVLDSWNTCGAGKLSEKLKIYHAFFYNKMQNMSSSHLETKILHGSCWCSGNTLLWLPFPPNTIPAFNPCQVVIIWLHAGNGDRFQDHPCFLMKLLKCLVF